MRLHRDQPPNPYPGQVLIGTNGESSVCLNVEPREIMGATTAALMRAFDKACARIWGQHWQGSLELVCDLRKGTARKWMKDGQIPPPMIVFWIAYLSARADARTMGKLLEAIAISEDILAIDDARLAFVGLRG